MDKTIGKTMRWSTKKWQDRAAVKFDAKYKWHRWFAWYPIQLTYTRRNGAWRWLEYVDTKIVRYDTILYNEYKDIK